MEAVGCLTDEERARPLAGVEPLLSVLVEAVAAVALRVSGLTGRRLGELCRGSVSCLRAVRSAEVVVVVAAGFRRDRERWSEEDMAALVGVVYVAFWQGELTGGDLDIWGKIGFGVYQFAVQCLGVGAPENSAVVNVWGWAVANQPLTLAADPPAISDIHGTVYTYKLV